MLHLKHRRDFLAAQRAKSVATRGSVVQARARGDDAPARIGFTVTKKLGNAVARNRIRRRLKEAARLSLPDRVKPGFDYVFIGRAASMALPFTQLMADLCNAVGTLNEGGGRSGQARAAYGRKQRGLT